LSHFLPRTFDPGKQEAKKHPEMTIVLQVFLSITNALRYKQLSTRTSKSADQNVEIPSNEANHTLPPETNIKKHFLVDCLRENVILFTAIK